MQQNLQVHARIERLQQVRKEAQCRVSRGSSGMEKYVCGISQAIMVDPVTAADGMTYERRNIEMWT